MTTPTIDTLALANKLKKARAEGKQAEAMAEAIATGVSGAGGELATKADLTSLKAELKADLAKMETRLTNRFYAVAAGLAALIVGQGALTVGILLRLVVGGE